MTVDDNEMQKLWKLTNELTAQLVFNRNTTLELKQQLADLQEKARLAPLNISGYGLKHQYATQDQADYKLRIANERLREENSQLQEQVREYERWMEYIMTKFRLQNFAMAQSRRESMHEAYKMTEQGNETAMRLQEENMFLQARLSDLGNVARKAIHEEQYFTTETLIESLESENRALREMLGVAEGGTGPIAGRLHFRAGEDDDDDDDENGMHRPRNRVSFPSTGTGSNVASSGSDREQQQQGQQGQQPQRGQQGQPNSLPRYRKSQGSRHAMKTPVSPLSVQTGMVLRSPKSSSSTTTVTSLSSPQSIGSPTSLSPWSSSTSASSSTVVSPKTTHKDPLQRIQSIRAPLEDVDLTDGLAATENEAKQGDRRGKITNNTDLISLEANKAV
ncbi:hypothetical protein BGX28_004750 [Mortierella sp. GBA30]|nr:hypothetical protein BGX28_004750 [Mortierella sp. GBA30]